MKVKKLIKRILGRRDAPNLFRDLDSSTDSSRRLPAIFISGVGRSGTHFIASLFEHDQNVAAYHMDDIGDAVGDSFTWYSKFFRLPVSSNGFLESRAFLARHAASRNKVYLESNPMIAFSLADLNTNFDCRFIIMVRNPKKVVESHFNKGWYEKVSVDMDGIPGYQYFHERPNHFFSRIMPADLDSRARWMNYTRHGKIAWMWRATYERIFEQALEIDNSKLRVCVLDDFTYERYCQMAEFVGTNPVTRERFNGIADSKPGKGKVQKVEWNETNKEEFKHEVGIAISRFAQFGFSEKWLSI